MDSLKVLRVTVRWFVLLGAILHCDWCHASRPLTLAEAITNALAANPEITTARYAAQETGAAVSEARVGALPKLSLVGQYSTSDDIRTQLPDSNLAVIKLDEDLFQGGRIFSEIARLNGLNDSAVATVDQKRLEVALAVKESYFRGLNASAAVHVWVEAKVEFANLLKLIEPKFTVGAVPEYDYAKIRFSLSQYEQSRLKAATAFGHELYVLGAVMGERPPEALAEYTEIAPPDLEHLNVDSILTRAIPRRPDLQASAALIVARQAALRNARLERLPTLKLSADYGYSGLSASDLSIGWGFTAQMAIPVFDFGLIDSKVARAGATLQAEQSRQETLRLKVRTEIYDTVQEVQATWAALQASEQNLLPAKRAYRSSLQRYRTRIAPMTELSDAHDLWVQSRIGLAQAKAAYRIALARLEAVEGVIDRVGAGARKSAEAKQ